VYFSRSTERSLFAFDASYEAAIVSLVVAEKYG
jgi:hypothetical protein